MIICEREFNEISALEEFLLLYFIYRFRPELGDGLASSNHDKEGESSGENSIKKISQRYKMKFS